jgi:hypothetical protein
MASFIQKLAALPEGDQIRPEDRSALLSDLVESGYPKKAAIEAIALALPGPRSSGEAVGFGAIWASSLPVGRDRKKLPLRTVRFMGNYSDRELDVVLASINETSCYDRNAKIDYVDYRDFNISLNSMMIVLLAKFGVGTYELSWESVPDKYKRFIVASIIEACKVNVFGLSHIKNEKDRESIIVEDKEILLIAKDAKIANVLMHGMDGLIIVDKHKFVEQPIIDEQGLPCGILVPEEFANEFLSTVVIYSYRAKCLINNNENDIEDYQESLNHTSWLRGDHRDILNEWIDLQINAGLHLTPKTLCNITPSLISRTISYMTAYNILKKKQLVNQRQKPSERIEPGTS